MLLKHCVWPHTGGWKVVHLHMWHADISADWVIRTLLHIAQVPWLSLSAMFQYLPCPTEQRNIVSWALSEIVHSRSYLFDFSQSQYNLVHMRLFITTQGDKPYLQAVCCGKSLLLHGISIEWDIKILCHILGPGRDSNRKIRYWNKGFNKGSWRYDSKNRKYSALVWKKINWAAVNV